MRRRLTALLLLFTGLLFGSAALAATVDDVSCCEGLSASDRERVEQHMAEEYLYDCCEDTVAVCLAEAEPCPLAKRLAGEICRRVQTGKTDEEIKTALALRARSMMPGSPKTPMDLTDVPVLGSEDAPVLFSMYACTRCPFCSKMSLELLEQFEEGGVLHGKVRWAFKLFPLKGHEGSVEGGLAAMAAAQQGLYWPYMKVVYADFDHYESGKLTAYAKEAGLDIAVFEAASADPATREELISWKREGVANGVRATPTLYINGRLWQGELDTTQIIDLLLEEYERVTAP